MVFGGLLEGYRSDSASEEKELSERRLEIESKLEKYNVFSSSYNKWHKKWMEEFGE